MDGVVDDDPGFAIIAEPLRTVPPEGGTGVT